MSDTKMHDLVKRAFDMRVKFRKRTQWQPSRLDAQVVDTEFYDLLNLITDMAMEIARLKGIVNEQHS